MSLSLNKTRVSLMKYNKTNYTKLKRYRKLILKDRSDVDYKNYRYFLINYLLNLDQQLWDTYELYQDLLNCIKNGNVIKLNVIIKNYKNEYSNLSDYMKVSMKTIVAHK